MQGFSLVYESIITTLFISFPIICGLIEQERMLMQFHISTHSCLCLTHSLFSPYLLPEGQAFMNV